MAMSVTKSKRNSNLTVIVNLLHCYYPAREKEPTMQETIEFRIRTTPETTWENSPVVKTITLGNELDTRATLAADAHAIAECLAAENGEVRWNYKGQTQGHYVSATE